MTQGMSLVLLWCFCFLDDRRNSDRAGCEALRGVCSPGSTAETASFTCGVRFGDRTAHAPARARSHECTCLSRSAPSHFSPLLCCRPLSSRADTLSSRSNYKALSTALAPMAGSSSPRSNDSFEDHHCHFCSPHSILSVPLSDHGHTTRGPLAPCHRRPARLLHSCKDSLSDLSLHEAPLSPAEAEAIACMCLSVSLRRAPLLFVPALSVLTRHRSLRDNCLESSSAIRLPLPARLSLLFDCRQRQASIKLAQPFPAPELRTKILRTLKGFF